MATNNVLLSLAASGFVAVYLVPYLKYPANPPAVGNPDTIGTRTGLYFVMIVLSIIAMFVVEWWIANPSSTPRIWARPAFRALAYNACLYAIVFFGFFGHRDFIYFQF